MKKPKSLQRLGFFCFNFYEEKSMNTNSFTPLGATNTTEVLTRHISHLLRKDGKLLCENTGSEDESVFGGHYIVDLVRGTVICPNFDLESCVRDIRNALGAMEEQS